MKIFIKKFLISVIVANFVFLLPTTVIFAQAQGQQPQYRVLAPLPGITTGNCSQNSPTTGTDPNCQTTISQYIPAAYRLAVGIAVALAFIMITVGGITYATSDALSGKQDGRRYIENAITGLLLVIGSWVILNTINPNMLRFNLDIRSVPGNNNQQQQPIDPTAGCPNCVAMTNLPLKPGIGNQINQTMYNKLVQLNTLMGANNINWQITEGFPPVGYSASNPTGIHTSTCHGNGTCVDANLIVNAQLDPVVKARYLNSLYTYAIQSGMSRAVYEVQTQAEYDTLRRNGYTGNLSVIRQITAPHFSLYN